MTIRLAAIFALLLCIFPLALATANADQASDRAAIAQALSDLKAAYRAGDGDTIRSILTPDAEFLTPYYTTPHSVDQIVRGLSKLKINRDETHNPKIEFFGKDAALMTFDTSFDGTYLGQRPSWSWVFTSTLWLREGDRWRVRFLQETPISGPN